MKRVLFLFLAAATLLAGCDQKGSLTRTQANFLKRLKRAQDTVNIFSQRELKQRVVNNMNRYVRDTALNFKGWHFKVTKIDGQLVYLRTPLPKGDTTGFNVEFLIEPANAAGLGELNSKLKPGAQLTIDGELAMKTPEGQISMDDYFYHDSLKFIRLVAKSVN